jgi:hypothetical protein
MTDESRAGNPDDGTDAAELIEDLEAPASEAVRGGMEPQPEKCNQACPENTAIYVSVLK